MFHVVSVWFRAINMKHVKIVKNEGSELTAAALRSLATKADKGEIVGVVVAAVKRDRTIASHLGGLCSFNNGMALEACAKTFNRLINQT